MDEVVKVRRQKIWRIKESRVIPLPAWWCRDKARNDEVSISITNDGNLLIKPVED
jgi:hypothetical protein